MLNHFTRAVVRCTLTYFPLAVLQISLIGQALGAEKSPIPNMTDGEMTIEDHTSCPGGDVSLPIIFPEVGPHTFELPPGVNHYQYQSGGAGFSHQSQGDRYPEES